MVPTSLFHSARAWPATASQEVLPSLSVRPASPSLSTMGTLSPGQTWGVLPRNVNAPAVKSGAVHPNKAITEMNDDTFTDARQGRPRLAALSIGPSGSDVMGVERDGSRTYGRAVSFAKCERIRSL